MVALTVVLDGLLHGDSGNDSDFKESPTLHLCSIKIFRCISCLSSTKCGKVVRSNNLVL